MATKTHSKTWTTQRYLASKWQDEDNYLSLLPPVYLMPSQVNFDVILSVMSNKKLIKQLLSDSSDKNYFFWGGVLILSRYFIKDFIFYTHKSPIALHVQSKF